MRCMPRSRGAVPAALLSLWLLLGLAPLPARAQLHELPPSASSPSQALPYGSSTSNPAPRSEMRDPFATAAPDGAGPALNPPGTYAVPSLDGIVPPQKYFDANTCANQPLYYGYGSSWTWQLLPDGLMYKSYLAGPKEARIGTQWFHLRGHGWVWDTTLGAHVGVLRFGTQSDFWPEGWQLDFEGAAFPRLDLVEEHDRDLISSDYKVEVPLTTRQGPWEAKFGYYHLSSHLGDEFLLSNPGAERINYRRESLVAGLALRPHRDWRVYGETGYAFLTDGGAKPWEFQFGAEYSQAEPTGAFGSPFAAANGHLRQENHFSGNITIQTGWQWRGQSGHLLRVGAHFFDGASEQYEFFAQHEQQIGLGLWYDY